MMTSEREIEVAALIKAASHMPQTFAGLDSERRFFAKNRRAAKSTAAVARRETSADDLASSLTWAVGVLRTTSDDVGWTQDDEEQLAKAQAALAKYKELKDD